MAALLAPLAVIWIHDGLIRPPGPKMVACLCPEAGLFARINTAGWRRGSVPLARRLHPFLLHDSHLECGAIFELDDYVVQQALDPPSRGVLGMVAAGAVGDILAAVHAAPALRTDDKAAILAALTGIAPSRGGR